MRRYQNTTQSIPCSGCRIGMMRPTAVTYITFARGRMITVPDFPAWECDICKKCEFDIDALEKLSLLLNPPTRPRRSIPRGKSAGDSPSVNPHLPK